MDACNATLAQCIGTAGAGGMPGWFWSSEPDQTMRELLASRDELRNLSALLVTIQEDERRRISMDLHDGLGQSLSLIRLSLDNAARLLADGAVSDAREALQQLIPRVKDALVEVRRVSTELRPSVLDDLGILPTLSWFFREFESSGAGIAVERSIEVREEDVPAPLRIVLFRILQEAFNNIVKHARADRVRVFLDRSDDILHLRVEDNGCGFETACVACCSDVKRRGLGLFSMKERASLSGGVYRLCSAPGLGTRIDVAWSCGPSPDQVRGLPAALAAQWPDEGRSSWSAS